MNGGLMMSILSFTTDIGEVRLLIGCKVGS